MITDAETNFVYFSGLLKSNKKYQPFHDQLIDILNKHQISYGYLPETRDIWCRDYMPVQVAKGRFIEYRYDPDYLLDRKGRSLKTYPDLVCQSIGLKTVKSHLILDGGNVIRWKNMVILTDKVIPENAYHYRKAELLKKLEEAFEVNKIILIPWYPKDEFGHADGMIRFVDENTVLVDGYYRNKKSGIGEKLFRVLKSHHLEAVSLQFEVKSESNYNWGYLNFLQMKDLLLVPQVGIDEDRQAIDQIMKLFPEYATKGKFDTIDAAVLIKDGGVLNCASWNIKKINVYFTANGATDFTANDATDFTANGATQYLFLNPEPCVLRPVPHALSPEPKKERVDNEGRNFHAPCPMLCALCPVPCALSPRRDEFRMRDETSMLHAPCPMPCALFEIVDEHSGLK